MKKRILHGIVLVMLLLLYALQLTSCGNGIKGIKIESAAWDGSYDPYTNSSSGNVEFYVGCIDDGKRVTAFVVNVKFFDRLDNCIATRRVTRTDVEIDDGVTSHFTASFGTDGSSAAIPGEVTRLEIEPHSMTLTGEGNDGGFSVGSIFGIIGGVIGVVFVCGVLYGLFFD